MNYLDDLNQAQREAVLHKDGPLLIIAGAGAGKTKTLTYRILHLIKQGVAPSSILAITFTNKAAKEMRERVDHLLSHEPSMNVPVTHTERPFMSTFHSLGVHIIKENARLLDLPRHFSIFDRSDSKRAVKEALDEAGIDPKQFEPGKILNIISKEKGEARTVTDYSNRVGNNYFPRIVADIWKRYEKILANEKALDFDDLLLKTLILLKQKPEVLAEYQKRWKYIHIDEYQDTNRVQYSIVNMLAAAHKNLCVVGDSDQMIYSWRGANIENILNFEKDYPEAQTVLLEQNYRSTQTILTAANRVIKKNKIRKEKNLFTQNAEGDRIGVYSGYDEADEAGFIAEKSAELIRQGVSAREIAVLYRANFQSRVLEDAFLMNSVAYQVLGTRFFERKEVKDVLSYIRAALTPEALGDVKRIINVPVRGLGKVTILKLFANQADTLPAATRAKIDAFYTILGAIKLKALESTPSETVKYAIKISGIEEMLRNGKTEEDLERLENIKELVTLATKYDGLSPENGIESLLADAALASDQDSLMKNQDAVKLMTIHASKGLEFEYVFVTGLEENLFPHKRMNADMSDADMEEERRLFYVALTRARKKLFLTYAGVRTIFGSKQVNVPSEFIIEMEDDLVQAEQRNGSRRHSLKTIYFD
jgi:DNA helicase-2/ATP-dependent DNA helicase PcrA